MSLVFADSFDQESTTELQVFWAQNFGAQLSTTTFRTGTAALSGGGARPIPTPLISVTLGFAFRSTFNGDNLMASIRGRCSGPPVVTGTHVELNYRSDGRVAITRPGDTNTLVGNVSMLMTPTNRWHYVEWEATVGTNAQQDVWVDGAHVLSAIMPTAVTPAVCGTTTITTANSLLLGGGGGGVVNFHDDLYLANRDGQGVSAHIGDPSVLARLPNADTAVVEWTPVGSSTTTHFLNVNQVPADGDSSYNASGTASTRDLYAMTTIAATDEVPAIQLLQEVRDDGTGGPQTVGPVAVIRAAAGTGTALVKGAYSPPNFTFYERVPGTTNTMTGGDFNTGQFGVVRLT